MKYYDIDKAREPGTDRLRFEEFKLNVKGRGKSKKEKLALVEMCRSLGPKNEEEEIIIIDPESDYR